MGRAESEALWETAAGLTVMRVALGRGRGTGIVQSYDSKSLLRKGTVSRRVYPAGTSPAARGRRRDSGPRLPQALLGDFLGELGGRLDRVKIPVDVDLLGA